jgi:hypothetical protein
MPCALAARRYPATPGCRPSSPAPCEGDRAPRLRSPGYAPTSLRPAPSSPAGAATVRRVPTLPGQPSCVQVQRPDASGARSAGVPCDGLPPACFSPSRCEGSVLAPRALGYAGCCRTSCPFLTRHDASSQVHASAARCVRAAGRRLDVATSRNTSFVRFRIGIPSDPPPALTAMEVWRAGPRRLMTTPERTTHSLPPAAATALGRLLLSGPA